MFAGVIVENNEILKIKDVIKNFIGVKALKGISLSLGRGETHALVGENGAGKSTLNKVICGVYDYDSGSIVYKGKPLPRGNPIAAQDLGIFMIPQDLGLIPKLSVMQNILLGREYGKLGIVDLKTSRNICTKIMNNIGTDLDLDTPVEELTIDQQQFVAIARVLSANAELIILDEPTSTLSEGEVENLFRIIQNLKKQHISIIYISHRLDEIFQIADNVTILKDGSLVKTVSVRETNKDEIINNMVGRNISSTFPPKRENLSEDGLMRLNNIAIAGKISNIDLDIMRGEILGIGGLVGMGQSELLNSIFGNIPISSGKVNFDNKELTKTTPSLSISNGVYFISSDRRDEMLFMCRSIKENISIATLEDYQRFGVINQKYETKVVNEQVEKYDLTISDLNQEVQFLSGGNQQKSILSRWLIHEPKLLLLDEPTQGIDVGAKEDIYRSLRELADKGIGIVVVFSDMIELLGMCDRIAVMYEGRITKIFDIKEATEEKIMAAASDHLLK
jgi:ABC-type sugar transport system ATPase subunit